jgi:hypothetical protein
LLGAFKDLCLEIRKRAKRGMRMGGFPFFPKKEPLSIYEEEFRLEREDEILI